MNISCEKNFTSHDYSRADFSRENCNRAKNQPAYSYIYTHVYVVTSVRASSLLVIGVCLPLNSKGVENQACVQNAQSHRNFA